jgi:hypothetical protein
MLQAHQGHMVTQGIRVRDVALDDGPVIVQGGPVVPNALALRGATIDFIASGEINIPAVLSPVRIPSTLAVIDLGSE